MLQVEDLVRHIKSGKYDSEQAATHFARLSSTDKAKVLKELEAIEASRNPRSAPADSLPLSIRTNQNCGKRQKDFIGQFVEKRGRATFRSKELAEKHRPYLADQRAPANFNMLLKELQYPLTFSHASGSTVEDIDGNLYVDIAGDFGVSLFGHAPEFLSSALSRQVEKGWGLCGRYEELGEAGELFCEITGQDRVAFCQSGTESLMCAVRLARAYTDREKIAVFASSYHGHADIFLNPFMPGVSAKSAEEVVGLAYGTEAALATIEAMGNELAAVVVEPVQSDAIDFQPVEFLRRLREITSRHKIVLIFDEMITGFRAHARGCQGLFGIDADLATYGKILGGGITAGAVAGRAEIMDWCDGGSWRYGDTSKPGPAAYIAGTHTQNPIKMAATLAVLRAVKAASPSLQDDLSEKTSRLVSRINEFAVSERLPFSTVSFRSQFKFRFSARSFTLTQALFAHLLQEHGVNYHLHGNCFLTAAHSEEDIDKVCRAVCDSLGILVREGFFFDVSEQRDDTATISVDEGPKLIPRSRTLENVSVANSSAAAAKTLPVLSLGEATRILKDLVGQFLELSPNEFAADDELASLGVDSIIMTGILNAIADRFQVKLSFKKLAGAESIEDVARTLCKEMAENPSGLPATEERADVLERPQAPGEGHIGEKRVHGGGKVDLVGMNGSRPLESERVTGEGSRHERNQSAEIDAGAVAIIGMSGAFGEASNLRVLWDYLIEGRSSITEVPETRWDWRALAADAHGANETPYRWGSFIKSPDLFDPLFFSISPREAKYMDPQERLLLMHGYNALEDACLKPSDLTGSETGVFVGYEYTDYAERMREIAGNIPDLDVSLCDLSGRTWHLANRLSYVFNLKGASEAINVNCAGSAVSISRACQSLVSGESSLALAAGVCLNLHPSSFANVAELLSPTGSMSVMGKGANGYVKGEACGVIVLKRLCDALRDGNPVYAVIDGVRQSYRGKGSSISEVRSDAVKSLIDESCRRLRVAPEEIRYIEVNGYSTQNGDAAEYEGIRMAVAGDGKGSCVLGSIKGNLGNLEPASGLASVVKMALAMEHGIMPPTLNVGEPNPQTDLGGASSSLSVLTRPTQLDAWRTDNSPIRVGVNSFADSGVNVHILLSEPPRSQNHEATSWSLDRHVFVFSAKTRGAFSQYAESWIAYLEGAGDIDLERMAYTQQVGREAFLYRFACVASCVDDIIAALRANVSGHEKDGCFVGPVPDKASEADLTSASTAADVARYWAAGGDVDWRAFYGVELPEPLHLLPGYPFTLKRYWIDGPSASAIDTDTARPSPMAATPVPVKIAARVAPEPVARPTAQAKKTAPSPAAGGDASLLNVMKKLRSIVLGFLEIGDEDGIDDSANFAEIGLTSISIVLLIDEVNDRFGLDLPEIVVFDYPNIAELAQHIVSLGVSPFGSDEPSGVARSSVVASGGAQTDLDFVIARMNDEELSIEEALQLVDQGSGPI